MKINDLKDLKDSKDSKDSKMRTKGFKDSGNSSLNQAYQTPVSVLQDSRRIQNRMVCREYMRSYSKTPAYRRYHAQYYRAYRKTPLGALHTCTALQKSRSLRGLSSCNHCMGVYIADLKLF